MKRFTNYAILFITIFGLLFVTGCRKKNKNEKNITVTYKVDGSVYNTQKYAGNEVIDLLAGPVKEGKEFQDWYLENTDTIISSGYLVTTDITLVAKYGYKYTLDAGRGTLSNGLSEDHINFNDGDYFYYPSNPVVSTDTNRVFVGWYDEDDNLVIPGSPVTSSKKLKAKYDIGGELFNIKYEANGGTITGYKVESYFEGSLIGLPQIEKPGFEFQGWYTDSAFKSNVYKYQNTDVTGDVTYYAKWVLVDVEYIDTIFNELLPEETSTNLYMPSYYQGVQLKWESGNKDIVNTNGLVTLSHQDKRVTVKLSITFQEEEYVYRRDLIVKRVEFEELNRPVAGYFYRTGITFMTDTVIDNLDIAYCAFLIVQPTGKVTIEDLTSFNKFVEDSKTFRKSGTRSVVSIAGGADNFSAACRQVGVSVVADNIIDYVVKYNFDGVDIDWEFPSSSEDTQYLNALCKSLRIKLNNLAKDGTPYLLTAAIPSHDSVSKFDLKTLNSYLDYVNMMSYDMNMAGRTTHLCPLFRARNDGNRYGVDDGISRFVNGGLDPEKIIIGGAFYGKTYTVKGDGLNPNKYPGLGANAELKSMQYSSGTVTYAYIARNFLTNENYVRYYDVEAGVPYLYSEVDKIFVTYEDEESLQQKTQYAYDNNMGIMFWEYGYDYENTLIHAICEKMAELKNGNQE